MQNLEKQIIELVAVDRLFIPLSSMEGKLKRKRPKLAEAINLPKDKPEYCGERVYARVSVEDKLKARTISQAVASYCEDFKAEGKILTQYIENERAKSETHLYFGVNPGKRLTADDYMNVMKDLGFDEVSGRNLYHELIEVSRGISKKRQEERSILIGSIE